MCHYHSSVLHLGSSKVYHIPSNSHSGIVDFYKIPENTDCKTVFLELEWDCIGEFALEKVVSCRNDFKLQDLSAKNIRAIERHYKSLQSLHNNPIPPKPGDTFYSWEFVDVWMKLNLPGLGEMISETVEDGIYPFTLDLEGYYHPFDAPLLKEIGKSLILWNYSHPFNAPLLEEVRGNLFLGDYSHPFNAPLLKEVRACIDLEGYSHPFNAPFLEKVGGGLSLKGYSHPFIAPLLKEIGGHLDREDYYHPFIAPLLKKVDGSLYLWDCSHLFNAPLFKEVGGYLDFRDYSFAEELKESSLINSL